MKNLYPFLLSPVYKDYLWGGSRIPIVFNRNLPDGIYAESWEVSDRSEGESVITNGSLAGKGLGKAIAEFGRDVTGKRAPQESSMPLLIKLIDAAQNLSVQVHPNDSNARLTGGEPKTEMWYVLEATEDARIYAGLKKGTTPAALRKAIDDKSLEKVLNQFTPKKGDVFFIPGGCVHAIGAGCLLLEVQQNSNTTYRVYDWGRVDNEGKSRQLHLEQAMKVINWDASDTPARKPAGKVRSEAAVVDSLLDTEWFLLERADLNTQLDVKGDGSSFRALFIESGSAVIRTADGDTVCGTGQSCLVPAAIMSWSMISQCPNTRVLMASV